MLLNSLFQQVTLFLMAQYLNFDTLAWTQLFDHSSRFSPGKPVTDIHPAIESETMSSPGFDQENKKSQRKKRKISVVSNIMDDNMPDVPREGVNHKYKVRAI